MNNFFYKKNYFLYSRTACTSFYVDIKYKKIIHKVLNTTIDFTFKQFAYKCKYQWDLDD